ncbi:hypothetical protein D3C72_2589430 [compost metagenome]
MNTTPLYRQLANHYLDAIRSALVLKTAQSTISPALTAVFSFRTVVLPFLSSSSMRRLSSASISAAFSLP